MNKFLLDKMNKALEGTLETSVSKKYRNTVASQFFIFNVFGVSNNEQLEKYHYLSQYVPTLVKRVYGTYDEQMSNKIIKYAIQSMDDNFTENDIKEIVAQSFSKLNLVKIAYPNLDSEIEPLKNYDLNKWITALNDIYVRTRVFGNRRDAINQVTQQWGNMDEKLDFERWVRFYEQGGSRMYKMADGFPMLPIQAIPGLTPKNNDRFVTEEQIQSQPSVGEKPAKAPKTLDEIKKKIVGRINSVEKMLLDYSKVFPNEAQYHKLLTTLLGLKQDVFSLKTASLINDVIYRAKISLEKDGADENTLNLFMKVAQLPPISGDPAGNDQGAAPEAETADPEKGKKAAEGFVEGLQKINPKIPMPKLEDANKTDVSAPGAAAAPPAQGAAPAAPAAPATPAASTIAKPEEQPKTASQRFNWVNISTPELQKFEKIANNIASIVKHASNFYITAQEAPVAPAAPPAVAPTAPVTAPVPAEATEAVETEAPAKKRPKPSDGPIRPVKTPSDASLLNIDNDVLESALNNITVKDVIVRMEALARVFKNREIARQLSIIDIMLDKLGIAGFFPALAEATRSALESNQYCQTRVEEVLSKLTSATDEKGTSLIGATAIPGKGNSVIDREMDEYMKEPKEKPATEPVVTPPAQPAPV